MKKLALLVVCLMAALSTYGQASTTYTNAGTTGTTLNSLAKINTSNQAVLATTTDTAVPAYIVVGGAGISGVAVVAKLGQALCTMDATNASFASQPIYVVDSTTTNGDCHAQTAAPSSGTFIVGFLAAPSTTSGSTALVEVDPEFYFGTASISCSALPALTGDATTGAGSCVTSVVKVNGGAIPTTSNLAATNGSGQITDSGVAPGNVVTASAAAGAANQICVSGGATKTCSYIDLPDVHIIPAANCNNTTGGAGWSIGSGGTVSCRAGTNNKGGYISITDTSTSFATFQLHIPEDWDTSSNPYIRFDIASTDTTTGHTIIPSIQVACYKGDGTTTDDVAANAAHSSSTITLNTTANQFWSNSNVQMNSTDVTGCVAGALMQITVGRATDTATNAEFYGATVTIPRKIVVQAN